MRYTALFLFFLAVVACSKTALRSDRVPDDDASSCSLPVNPRDVVLGVERHVIGQQMTPEGDIQIEAGEITIAAACTPKIECVQATAQTMDGLVALVRGLGDVRHRREQTSPHYGFRIVTARWAGGRCSVVDGVITPIDERDEKKFYVVYDAIRDAIVKSRDRMPESR
jgi:hypothetical protein